ncbi:MAG: hypothetical protein EXR11_01280 [Rhodospirillaceae bacterium]|nr:hypothetical protein [Rhodospirillaceae bacterium]
MGIPYTTSSLIPHPPAPSPQPPAPSPQPPAPSPQPPAPSPLQLLLSAPSSLIGDWLCLFADTILG